MRERIRNNQITKEVRAELPAISPEMVKERGCTFCPYYAGPYEKKGRCMMAICAWDDDSERFHPQLRSLIPVYKAKMEKAKEKYETEKTAYETLMSMFAQEMKEEAERNDECYDCTYRKCGPCIGICYKNLMSKEKSH